MISCNSCEEKEGVGCLPTNEMTSTVECDTGYCFTQWLENSQDGNTQFDILERGCFQDGRNGRQLDEKICNDEIIGRKVCYQLCDTDECNGLDNDPSIMPFEAVASMFTNPVFYGFLIFLAITVCIMCMYLACLKSAPCCNSYPESEYDDSEEGSCYRVEETLQLNKTNSQMKYVNQSPGQNQINHNQVLHQNHNSHQAHVSFAPETSHNRMPNHPVGQPQQIVQVVPQSSQQNLNNTYMPGQTIDQELQNEQAMAMGNTANMHMGTGMGAGMPHVQLQHPQQQPQSPLVQVHTQHSNLFEGPTSNPYTMEPAQQVASPRVTAVTSNYAGERQREEDLEREEEANLDQVGGQLPDFKSGRQNVKSPMMRATSVTTSMQNVHARSRSRNGGTYSQSSAHLSRHPNK